MALEMCWISQLARCLLGPAQSTTLAEWRVPSPQGKLRRSRRMWAVHAPCLEAWLTLVAAQATLLISVSRSSLR